MIAHFDSQGEMIKISYCSARMDAYNSCFEQFMKLGETNKFGEGGAIRGGGAITMFTVQSTLELTTPRINVFFSI